MDIDKLNNISDRLSDIGIRNFLGYSYDKNGNIEENYFAIYHEENKYKSNLKEKNIPRKTMMTIIGLNKETFKMFKYAI